MVKLIIEDDEGKTTVVPLIRDEITIGRKEGNTIRLTERNISRRHAKLLKQNGAIFLEDLDSYNGIRINGNRIAGRVAIAEGDRIQIGDYILGLKLEGAEIDSSHPAPQKKDEKPITEDLSGKDDAPLSNAATTITEIPGLDAAAPSAQVHGSAENLGRMVCVSTNFPGEEWTLNKTLMVLGRTDDNDIVINHRSISRHHARVTEENGHYTIIDLQSSNGVRVNGEPYGKVEIRRGDLIDLGHVRLRFVAPGEDFDFHRDASVVDISRPGSRGGLWAVLSVAAVLVISFFVWRTMSTDNKHVATKSDVPPSNTTDTQRGTPIPPPNDPQLIEEINQSMGTEQWALAIKKCSQLTGVYKTNAQLNCERAAMELAAHETFETAHNLYLQHQYLEVVRHRNKIPPESVYKTRDPNILTGAQTKFLAQARESLEEFVQQGACANAQELLAKILEVSPEDTAAAPLVERCNRPVVAVKKPIPNVIPKPHVRPKKNLVPKPELPSGPSMEDVEQAKELLAKAKANYMKANHSRAIDLAQQVLKLAPNDKGAISIIGSSYCLLKNEEKARWAYDKLPTADRNLLRKVCSKAGINL